MARQVTKAYQNRYCRARLEAAKYNDRFASRASAAEEIPGVTEDSLKKYELDITRPPNDVIALMADAYNAPELILWYCSNECPLGKNCREVPEMPPERTFVRLTNTLNKLNNAMRELAELMDDGAEKDQDATRIQRLRGEFLEARRRIDETLATLEKMQRQYFE
ncbi:MAG: transcriptional regulator [Clostridia bacterium]|nr:transcriptional regulator [Oscillospiraceae bacterium]MBQ3551647.1 transcriptional regulator [Clostridia bacterium]